jgi:putative NADPH-quinone reductase
MTKRILIIIGHPAKLRQSFSEVLAGAYQQGAQGAGYEVRLLNISRLNFDPILHEGYVGEQPLELDIIDAQQAILWAEHLVIVYPIWGYMIPALLKGFFERTFTRGFAYANQSNNPFKSGLLNGKSARIIQTTGMPSLVYRLFYWAHGAKALKSMLKFCGISPIWITYFGSIDEGQDKRKIYLDDTERLGKSGH